MVARVETLFG